MNKFRNHFNIDIAEACNFEEQDEKSCVVQGGVLPVAEILRRRLHGNIIDTLTEGTWHDNGHDSPDLEKIPDMEITERLDTVHLIGEMISQKVASLEKQKELQEYNQNELIQKSEIEFQKKVSEAIKKENEKK